MPAGLFQYSLTQIALFVTLLGCALAVNSDFSDYRNGLLILAGLILAALAGTGWRSRLVFAGLFWGVCVWRFVVTDEPYDEFGNSALSIRCYGQLDEIGQALSSYRKQHGSLPPTAEGLKPGQPPCSWRVRLLPYLGFQDVYDEYDFDQPWDSAHNMSLEGKVGYFFTCPFCTRAQRKYNTTYVALVTDNGPMRLKTGGAPIEWRRSSYPAVIECLDLGIHWMDPQDVFISIPYGSHVVEDRRVLRSRHGRTYLVYVREYLYNDGYHSFVETKFFPEDSTADERVKQLFGI